jgi:hypothetical protein
MAAYLEIQFEKDFGDFAIAARVCEIAKPIF